MKIMENYRNQIKKLDEGYSPANGINYNKKYLKRAVDLLQEEIYPIFPSSICFYVALLQKYLTDGLDFYWREPTYMGMRIDDVDYADDGQNITISDLKELIKEINLLCFTCEIGDFEEDTLQTIDSLLHNIFDSCCRWIKELFTKENIELCESSLFEEIQDIIDVCEFSGCIRDKESEKIKNNYSLNIVEFFKTHQRVLQKNTYDYQIKELTEELNLLEVKKHNKLVDGVLLGNMPILDNNDLQLENIWNYRKLNKDDWEYYVCTLEYLRTVVIQAISEETVYASYELGFSRIEKDIIDEITNGIVFCMSKGKVRKYDHTANIKSTKIFNYKDYDDENFIISQYLCDNLSYQCNEFKKSKTFTADEKQYMANCLHNISLISCQM